MAISNAHFLQEILWTPEIATTSLRTGLAMTRIWHSQERINPFPTGNRGWLLWLRF